MARIVVSRCATTLGRDHRGAIGARMPPTLLVDRTAAACSLATACARGRCGTRALAAAQCRICPNAAARRPPCRNGTNLAAFGVTVDLEFEFEAAIAALDRAARGTRAPCERQRRFALRPR